MPTRRPVVVVAMSGGVDSSVAAALLRDAGYRVVGASLRLWDSARRDDRVCSDAREAGAVAAALGVEHIEIDRRREFESAVVRPFVAAYAGGRTPNPCVACNSRFKLGALLEWALERGADFVATGHYARIRRERGRARLLRATDRARDQSYFLFDVDEDRLDRVLLPLGELTKPEVRSRARSLGLPVADKPESQDLCFGSPAELVGARGASHGPGEVVNEAGRLLGRHRGIEHYTIGQRRGLGVSAGTPLYVRSLDRESRRVTVGRRQESTALAATSWRWLAEPGERGERLVAQVRSRDPGHEAIVEERDEGRTRVRFARPVESISPGQAVVVYRGDEVAGGGWIERSLPDGEA